MAIFPPLPSQSSSAVRLFSSISASFVHPTTTTTSTATNALAAAAVQTTINSITAAQLTGNNKGVDATRSTPDQTSLSSSASPTTIINSLSSTSTHASSIPTLSAGLNFTLPSQTLNIQPANTNMSSPSPSSATSPPATPSIGTIAGITIISLILLAGILGALYFISRKPHRPDSQMVDDELEREPSHQTQASPTKPPTAAAGARSGGKTGTNRLSSLFMTPTSTGSIHHHDDGRLSDRDFGKLRKKTPSWSRKKLSAGTTTTAAGVTKNGDDALVGNPPGPQQRVIVMGQGSESGATGAGGNGSPGWRVGFGRARAWVPLSGSHRSSTQIDTGKVDADAAAASPC